MARFTFRNGEGCYSSLSGKTHDTTRPAKHNVWMPLVLRVLPQEGVPRYNKSEFLRTEKLENGEEAKVYKLFIMDETEGCKGAVEVLLR